MQVRWVLKCYTFRVHPRIDKPAYMCGTRFISRYHAHDVRVHPWMPLFDTPLPVREMKESDGVL